LAYKNLKYIISSPHIYKQIEEYMKKSILMLMVTLAAGIV